MTLDVLRENTRWANTFSRGGSRTRHALPRFVGKPQINYTNLAKLCSLQDADDVGDDSETPQNSHELFMKNYHTIFAPQQKEKKALEPSRLPDYNAPRIQLADRIPHAKSLKPHKCEEFQFRMSHSITDHLSGLHRHRISPEEGAITNARVSAIRKTLRKQPYERKSKDNEILFKHLRHFHDLSSKVPHYVLKELCTVAELDKWIDVGFTVFGNSGFYLILKGGVLSEERGFLPPPEATHNKQHQLGHEEKICSFSKKLTVGDSFGSLRKSEESDGGAKELSVVTAEPCEFLVISTSDYEKVVKKLAAKEYDRKLALVQASRILASWPKLSLKKIADLIKWRTFPAGRLLVSEGERCEVIGFIRKGTCSLKRAITVAHTLPNGKREQRTKNIVIGQLGHGDTFGEGTVLNRDVMKYSVTTVTPLEIGTISSLDVYDLDETTRSLLHQSFAAVDTQMTDGEIKEDYIVQEKGKEWNNFKHNVVNSVLLYRGILPGYSKWSRNPTTKSLTHTAFGTEGESVQLER